MTSESTIRRKENDSVDFEKNTRRKKSCFHALLLKKECETEFYKIFFSKKLFICIEIKLYPNYKMDKNGYYDLLKQVRWICKIYKRAFERLEIVVKDYEKDQSYDSEHIVDINQVIDELSNCFDCRVFLVLDLSEYSGGKIIPDSCFAKLRFIQKVILPNNATSIDRSAFYECINLETVLFPKDNTLERIGNFAFSRCISLTEVDLSSQNMDKSGIGISSFSRCNSLKSVKLGSRIEIIAVNCFYECKSLQSVSWENVRIINEGAFSLCSNLYKIGKCDYIKMIGKEAFSYCSALEEFKFPCYVGGDELTIESKAFDHSGIKKINLDCEKLFLGESVFSNTPLNTVTIKSSIRWLPEKTFYNCSNLFEVNLPLSLKYIETECFSKCMSLKEIAFPEHMISIGYLCFAGCTSLREFNIPKTLVSIESGAFFECPLKEDLKTVLKHRFAGRLKFLD